MLKRERVLDMGRERRRPWVGGGSSLAGEKVWTILQVEKNGWLRMGRSKGEADVLEADSGLWAWTELYGMEDDVCR